MDFLSYQKLNYKWFLFFSMISQTSMCFLHEIRLFKSISILFTTSMFLSSVRKLQSRSSFICLSLSSSETLVVGRAGSWISVNFILLSFKSATSGENKQISISSEISSKRKSFRLKFPQWQRVSLDLHYRALFLLYPESFLLLVAYSLRGLLPD